MSIKTLADFYPSKLVTISLSPPPERDTRTCEAGDAILFEEKGIAYTLLEELMRDDTHVTWHVLITAHWDESKLGTEEWVGLDLTRPLLDGAILVRGS
jgi:hypothetical protein